MHDANWIGTALKAARPRAVAALLRYFGNVELAEEAYQEACLKALDRWPTQVPPRNPTAWLILVGRNVGIDGLRRIARETHLPEAMAPPVELIEDELAESIDAASYGDDVLRLLFICCHPDLPATQQIALALRVVSGLSVAEIARAFLVSEAAMEQRITRAKRTVGQADVMFETPSQSARVQRLAAVSAMIYLTFNNGYDASSREAGHKQPLCDEAIRLGRLLLQLFPDEPEVLGLLALMRLQHSRAVARFDTAGAIVLLEDQDRRLWDRAAIADGVALTHRAFRLRRLGPYQLQAAIATLHARARNFEETDWGQIEQLYRALADFEPTPVVALNHAVAVSRARSPEEAFALVEPLASQLATYFYYHAVRGHLLERIGRDDEARQAYAASLGMATSAAEATQIRTCLDRLKRGR
ncbi:MAG: RNA polymerase sigma factor [Methylobacterium sp.]|uniref:RNA polymerase sigma factor n=1 Tax=Methylobacterium sp. TaxID=409 RepID=UPI0025F97772|nr:RNA polymerase sigma factor [Methylobacterium sp.]MBX9933111.1 RNA polymerase sigma factor [Methylobacterium sp.]